MSDKKVFFQANLNEETNLFEVVLSNEETQEGMKVCIEPVQFIRMTEYMDMILASYVSYQKWKKEARK